MPRCLSPATLIDVPRVEKLQESLGAAAPYTSDAAVRRAGQVGDVQALETFAADPNQSTSSRLLALILLRDKKGADPAFARAQYDALMKAEPEDTSILSTLVEELRNSKQPAAAREAVTAWLAHRPSDEHDLRWAHAIVLKADTFADEKRWREAEATIRPAVPAYTEEALTEAAWFLEEQGDWDGAMKLATAARERYPDGHISYAIITRLLWRQKKYAEAAGYWPMPASSAARSGTARWRSRSAFSRRPIRISHRAVRRPPGAEDRSPPLAARARNVGTRGSHKLAFAMLANLWRQRGYKAAIQIWAYDELAKSDGEAAAAEWRRRPCATRTSSPSLPFSSGATTSSGCRS